MRRRVEECGETALGEGGEEEGEGMGGADWVGGGEESDGKTQTDCMMESKRLRQRRGAEGGK